MKTKRDVLPDWWREKVGGRLWGAKIIPPDHPQDKRPRPVFVRGVLNSCDNVKLLMMNSGKAAGQFLPRNFSTVHEAQRYIEKRAELMKESKKILESVYTEDAARKLVRACLKTQKGIAAEGGPAADHRCGLALAALAEEIAFVTKRVVMDREPWGGRLTKAKAKRIADAIRLLKGEAPLVLAPDPDLVQMMENYFDPPKDYLFKAHVRHGRGGRPFLMTLNAVSVSLSEANIKLCGQQMYQATALLLAASSSGDVSYRYAGPRAGEWTIRNAYNNHRGRAST